MARKSKEEKIMEHGESVIEDFQTLYDKEARAVIEYNNLLKEYQKLNKRFNKIISINNLTSIIRAVTNYFKVSNTPSTLNISQKWRN